MPWITLLDSMTRVSHTESITLVAVILFLFFSTPVFYDITQIPEQYRWAIYLNPLTPIIINTRTIIFKTSAPGWKMVGLSWLTALVAFQFGFCVFMRLRRRFADVV